MFNSQSPIFCPVGKNINQELANVSRWAKTNKLTINPTKSHLLVVSPYLNNPSPDALITLDSSILKVEKSIKYLGINVDNQLLFGNHINQLRTTVSRSWQYDEDNAICSLTNTKTNLFCLHSFSSHIWHYSVGSNIILHT